jgi:hypothetical protein
MWGRLLKGIIRSGQVRCECRSKKLDAAAWSPVEEDHTANRGNTPVTRDAEKGSGPDRIFRVGMVHVVSRRSAAGAAKGAVK